MTDTVETEAQRLQRQRDEAIHPFSTYCYPEELHMRTKRLLKNPPPEGPLLIDHQRGMIGTYDPGDHPAPQMPELPRPPLKFYDFTDTNEDDESAEEVSEPSVFHTQLQVPEVQRAIWKFDVPWNIFGSGDGEGSSQGAEQTSETAAAASGGSDPSASSSSAPPVVVPTGETVEGE
uniref:Uncharacterized protein n=1 Tax=Chromera velia CCMP2878 TaxID=1169474 RepID=A0A0G4GP49_9ALVE|eukprot:Cvel_22751.t1-p1 / transcript=Cvel_22751.t1 / gene=Cvel_22751 / organism=Chromera_velia_CCMP2878 / gene_product=hypothetical protein / transcript_product=hypothetical protein / location=Cvel_scaffold2270:16271-20357(-) / protein_length=175 / sequence_SO=supercontig / SO=protein_coding / is_pseudo=false